MKEKTSLIILGIACTSFFIIHLPFLTALPYLDGNIDFVQTHDFYTGGFSRYFANWTSVHPPLKIMLASVFYTIFGFSVFAYNLLGLLMGLLGLWGMHWLAKNYGLKTAVWAVIFLATSPLFIATSLFSLTDFMLTVWVLIALGFYSREKIFSTTLFTVLAVLTKETALLLPFTLIITELFFPLLHHKRLTNTFKNILILLLPFVFYTGWSLFLHWSGKGGWSDWIFAETAAKGSFYTIFYNLFTFGFLNQYAYQNWAQLLFVNSNWVYLLVCTLVSLVIFFTNNNNVILTTSQKKTLICLFFFIVGYVFTVLSFQTYTIIRYGLPVVVILYFLTAVTLGKFAYQKVVFILGILLVVVNLFSQFRSVDRVALAKWGTIRVLGQRFYNLPAHLAGNDGITYNFAYWRMVYKRSQAVYQADKEGLSVRGDCYWLFRDPKNDYKTLKNLNLRIPLDNPCLLIFRGKFL